ncbi:glycosyltransferase [Pontibacter ummariensis]|nr:glycosyltransferase [Pontibacter ummariensis]
MIPVYNCSQFLVDTLESVLMQEIPEQEMQIEVVDDASTDTDVEALVKQIGKGRVSYYRQAQNVGSLRNFETCINRARGKIVHLLHGDDKVRKGYYSAMEKLLHQYPEAGAAFCRYQPIDAEDKTLPGIKAPERDTPGLLNNWLLRISERQRIQYAAIAVRREVYEKLGAFYGLFYAEDWEMWVRIARHYPVAYTPEILAEYRKHTTSISGVKHQTGQYLVDIAQAIELIQTHLPPAKRKSQRKKARMYYAHYGIIMANRIWRATHNKEVVKTNLREALKLNQNIKIWYAAVKVHLKMLLNIG